MLLSYAFWNLRSRKMEIGILLKNMGTQDLKYKLNASGGIPIKLVHADKICSMVMILPEMYDVSLRHAPEMKMNALPDTSHERLHSRFFRIADFELSHALLHIRYRLRFEELGIISYFVKYKASFLVIFWAVESRLTVLHSLIFPEPYLFPGQRQFSS